MVAFFISKSYLQKSQLRFTGHYNGRLAQLGEQLPYKQRVGSSILSSPKPFFFLSSPLFHSSDTFQKAKR